MDNSTIIDKYLRQELSGEELEAFNSRLLNDQELKDELRVMKNLQGGIRLSVMEEKLDFLKKLESSKSKVKTLPPRTTEKKTLNIYKFAAAATIVMAVGIGLFNNLDPRYDNQELFAANFSPDNYSYVDRSGIVDARKQCYDNYNAKDWTAATKCLLQLYNSEGYDIDQYFLGVAHLGLDNPKAAIEALSSITETSNFYSMEDINWYSSLAYLKQKETQKAVEHLSQIKSGKHYTAAQELVSIIK